jgi:hypothetical protein
MVRMILVWVESRGGGSTRGQTSDRAGRAAECSGRTAYPSQPSWPSGSLNLECSETMPVPAAPPGRNSLGGPHQQGARHFPPKRTQPTHVGAS